MSVPLANLDLSEILPEDERFVRCTVHAVESNDVREVNEILQAVVDKTDSQHFVLLSQSVTKAQLMDVDGKVQVHVGTTSDEVKHIILTVPINEGTSPSLFMIAGREFA